MRRRDLKMRLAGVDDSLELADRRLERDGVIEVELSSVHELLSEPQIEPLGRSGPYESGVAYVSSVLESLRRLPERVTVRVVVDGDSLDEREQADAEAAFRDYCRFRAEDSWRQAMIVRRTGARQLPRALVIAAFAAALAAACGSLVQNVNGVVFKAILYVIAGIGAIAAWVITWLPIEELFFDWRPQAHAAAVFDLLRHSRLEFQRQAGRDRQDRHSTGQTATGQTAARAGAGRSP